MYFSKCQKYPLVLFFCRRKSPTMLCIVGRKLGLLVDCGILRNQQSVFKDLERKWGACARPHRPAVGTSASAEVLFPFQEG